MFDTIYASIIQLNKTYKKEITKNNPLLSHYLGTLIVLSATSQFALFQIYSSFSSFPLHPSMASITGSSATAMSCSFKVNQVVPFDQLLRSFNLLMLWFYRFRFRNSLFCVSDIQFLEYCLLEFDCLWMIFVNKTGWFYTSFKKLYNEMWNHENKMCCLLLGRSRFKLTANKTKLI